MVRVVYVRHAFDGLVQAVRKGDPDGSIDILRILGLLLDDVEVEVAHAVRRWILSRGGVGGRHGDIGRCSEYRSSVGDVPGAQGKYQSGVEELHREEGDVLSVML